MELIKVNHTPISPASLATILEGRYAALEAALTAQGEIEVQIVEAEQKLTEARGIVLRANADDPKALGINEAIREAAIAELTREERIVVEGLEVDRLRKRQAVELARLQVESGRALLRLLEVNAGMQG